MLGVVLVLVIGGIIALTTVLVPENLHPAYEVATEFMNAAGQGDDSTAIALLSEDMQAYVAANCPAGSVAACVDEYTPAEWGDLIAAVYRRSAPEGTDIWHVQLVATYEEGQGFAGVCIYHQVENLAAADRDEADWRVTAWSGFVSCDDRNSGLSALRREDAINRAP